MKKILLSVLLMIYGCINAQIIVNEGFEMPEVAGNEFATMHGWSGDMFRLQSAACSSGFVLKNYFAPSGTNYIIYSSNQSNATALNYSFKFFVYQLNAAVSGIIETDYSIDNGSTWIALGAPIPFVNSSTISPCTPVSGTIPAGSIPIGADFKFRIRMHNTMTVNPSYFSINIDDIKLEQIPSTVPSCLNTGVYYPIGNASVSPIGPTFQWYPSAGATGYYFSLGTTPGGTDLVNNVNVGNTTHYTTSPPLTPSKQYFITIVPYNSFGNAPCSISSSFTPALYCAYNLNPKGYLVSPSTTFTWEAVQYATGYKITVGTTPQGNDVFDNFDVGNVTSFKPSNPLLFNTQYYFSVKAYNATNESVGCREENFKTQMPCAPLAFHSPNGYVISSLTPTLSWGTKDIVAPTGGFKLSLGKYTGSNSTNNVLDNFDVGYVSSYQITTPLEPGTTYFYRVAGYNYQFEQFNNSCYTIYFTTPGGALGTSEVQKEKNDIIIYPNPTKEFIMINSKKKINNINIVDFAGRKLKELKIENDKIDLKDLSKGNYILQIQFTDNTVYNKTVTKE